MNSRNKGKTGERQWAEFCREHGFTEARRGVQFKGGFDSPDVTGLPGIHIEVKRQERTQIQEWMKQSIRDCEGKAIPIVAHRRNREEWLVTMRAEDWITLYKGWINNEQGRIHIP